MIGKILICMGTSGISAGAESVSNMFEAELQKKGLTDKYKVVKTGDRGLFRDILVDVIEPGSERVTYEFVKASSVSKIVEEHLVGGKPVKEFLAGEDYKKFFANQMRIVLALCGEIDPESIDEYVQHEGYKSLDSVLKTTPDEIIEKMKISGLRGRGGAGFPTWLKWNLCKEEKNDLKYVICNADEGDPGAFMDRSILEGDPQCVLEGMIIAGYAIGATEGFIYCLAEYPLAIKRLNIAISQARSHGYLGKNILGTNFLFDITVVQGAGAFVCGEETALMESIEGRRGCPRPKPPFPSQSGLWGKPSIINNVETFANVRHIFIKGPEWFSSIGTEKSKGTKVFALAGKVKNTGLIEVPMGTTIRQLVFEVGGGMLKRRIGLKGVLMGGPSGGCLPEELCDLSIDYESINNTGAIMGSGGLIVMDKKTCMVDVAKYFISFTVSESCGKCVPCRIGLKRMQEVLDQVTKGKGTQEHLDFLEEMSNTIKNTALCGLGNTAPNPVLTTLRYFRNEYESHINKTGCPAKVCTELVKFEVNKEKCSKCGLCFKVCPVNAIIWSKGEIAVIDKAKCTRCRSCVNICDFMAIE